MPKRVRIDIPLVAMRKRHGQLSQDQLAKMTGISQRTLSALETGKQQRIDLSTIARLIEVYNCDPGALFEVEDVPEAEVPAKPPNGRRKRQDKESLGRNRAGHV